MKVKTPTNATLKRISKMVFMRPLSHAQLGCKAFHLIDFKAVIGRSRGGSWACTRAGRALCVLTVLAVSLGFASSAQALTACEATKPTIEHVSLTEETPAGVMFEAEINPQDSETTYEFVIVWQLHNPENPSDRGEPVHESLREVGGPISAGAGDVAVSGLVTGLERGYTYWYEVVASNLAGKTRSGARWFSYYYTGGYPDGIGSGPPHEAEVTPCEIESGNEAARRNAMEGQAEEQPQKVKEQEEQQAKEAALRAAQAAALKKREEQEAEAPATGSISLAATSVTVQSNGTALVKLTCLGVAGCRGKLTLRAGTRSKGRKKARPTSIGTLSFTIVGDEAKMVKVKLDAAGRALLGADHGRLNASLAILELAPGSANAQTKAVQLVQRKTAKGRKR
jgi:hypothetical protein